MTQDNQSAPAPDQGAFGPLFFNDAGHGHTSLKAFEPDAPKFYALVTDIQGQAVPKDPESDWIIIAVCETGVQDPLQAIEVAGRYGLNQWYLKHVGHEPDGEGDGATPIYDLIRNVASHLMLRMAAEDEAELDSDNDSTAAAQRRSSRP